MKKNAKSAFVALIAVIIVAAIVIAIVAPNGRSGSTASATSATAGTTAATDTGSADTTVTRSTSDTLLVTVNGDEIREDNLNLYYWKNMILSDVKEQYNEIPDDLDMNVVNQYAMDYAVKFALMKQYLNISREDVDTATAAAKADWDDIIEQSLSQVGITDESTEEEKAAGRDLVRSLYEQYYGETDETVMAKAEVALVSQAMQALEADESIEVTDEDVRKYYADLVAQDMAMLTSAAGEAGETEEEKKAYSAKIVSMYEMYLYYGLSEFKYYMPEGYRGITHILLKVDDELLSTWKDLNLKFEQGSEEVTQEMVDAAKQAILDSVQDTVAEIKGKLADGASFEDLIVEYGQDPGMQNAETRAKGYAVHADSVMWDSAFTAGAMALENVGDIGEPIVGQNGVHILHYLRDIPGGATEYTDELKETLREEILNNRKSEAFYAKFDPWAADAEIVWTEAGEAWKMPAEEAAAEEPAAEEPAAGEPAEETAGDAEAPAEEAPAGEAAE